MTLCFVFSLMQRDRQENRRKKNESEENKSCFSHVDTNQFCCEKLFKIVDENQTDVEWLLVDVN